MITGIPDYNGALPIEYCLRCVCGRRFIVFTRAGPLIGDAEARACERAAKMQTQFIDARETPFMNCECGQALDFTAGDSGELVM